MLHEIIPAGWSGVLQCDGYSAYASFIAKHDQGGDALVIQGGCMAHLRRGFLEAKDHAPAAAGALLKEIAKLYRIEEELRAARAGPAERLRRRQAESRPIFEALNQRILSERPRHLPKSSLGEAITYALGQWERVKVFLRDGRVELDNNLVENAIRPTAIGKKNWMFIGEAEAGQNAAILYTLVENCRRQGIDPLTYFRDLLSALPSMTNKQVPDWTPAAWTKKRRAAVSLTTLAS